MNPKVIKNRILLFSLLLLIGLTVGIYLGDGASTAAQKINNLNSNSSPKQEQLASTQAKITYQPYIQPGDAMLIIREQMAIAWQTNESQPHPNAYQVELGKNGKYTTSVVPVGRVVDNYLKADPKLPVPATATGARTNYYALLKNLDKNTEYDYRVTGPGLAKAGFQASFRTRKETAPFSFQVMGDEGFFPPDPNNKPYLANYVARIVNTMYNVANIEIPGVPRLPKPDLGLNTGDNVYLKGSEGNYSDFWMPVWNSDTASNSLGAPYIRSIPYYIVAGNHDLGGSGDRANLLADDSGGRYSGNLDGGDALQYFNNYYFPLNGPTGVDLQYIFNVDKSSLDGFYFSYQGKTYNSPTAIEAFRASTTVNTGQGEKRQIDRMSNYSFDSGNAHFVFLDANPHLFNAIVSYSPIYKEAPSNFPEYPSKLRDWLINDLDASKQPWKIVVFHQAAFSSGNSTLRNNQMRRITKFLEDHGVNLVYNGHEHNYQRTLPLRALDRVGETPTTKLAAAVAIDPYFDGKIVTVPDGVIYVVEGAGGDRDFDNNLKDPRGQGEGVDQEDSAQGSYSFGSGLNFANGSASWLDTHLTNAQMSSFFPDAGNGSKITARFKSKVFSFGHVVIDGNRLTHYQISEPLQNKSSATPDNPYPYGTDANNKALNDPIPETLVNPATGAVVTPLTNGIPALLDKFTITKPDVSNQLVAKLTAPTISKAGNIDYSVSVTNNSRYALNGTQIVITLPKGVSFISDKSQVVTQSGEDIVFTLGRLEIGKQRQIHLQGIISANMRPGTKLSARALVRSSTASSVIAKSLKSSSVNHL